MSTYKVSLIRRYWEDVTKASIQHMLYSVNSRARCRRGVRIQVFVWMALALSLDQPGLHGCRMTWEVERDYWRKSKHEDGNPRLFSGLHNHYSDTLLSQTTQPMGAQLFTCISIYMTDSLRWALSLWGNESIMDNREREKRREREREREKERERIYS